jgi:hypothetical protein
MSAKILEECPVCHKKFVQDSEELYWHIKIHLAKIELKQQEEQSLTPTTTK